jgi:hypothetical protein
VNAPTTLPLRSLRAPRGPAAERGLALVAVLIALTLLLLLALPFAISMAAGVTSARHDAEVAAVHQASASARELLLADAALSHPSVDLTPGHDGLAEFPARIDVPAGFEALGEGCRVRFGGEVTDLQRFLGLDGASPLLFANVLGSTTRLREDLTPDASALLLEDATRLPDSGHVWVAGERFQYSEKRGNDLLGVVRGRPAGGGGGGDGANAEKPDTLLAGALVLDYRCVLAAAWPFLSRGSERTERAPYRAIGDLVGIGAAGFGTFTPSELDQLSRAFAVDAMATTAATWGRPERVFNQLDAGSGQTMVVKSALHIGPGSTVRLRDTRTGQVEYALVMSASTQRGLTELLLPSVFLLTLLEPVVHSFPATDTLVEPMIPAPVNVNTAPVEVLTAVLAELSQAQMVRVPDAKGLQRQTPRTLGRAMAQDLAEEWLRLRGGAEAGEDTGGAPFQGWQDLVARVFEPRLAQAVNDQERLLWLYVYRNLQTGRDSALDMGTAPICFASGPWFHYRAGASRMRSVVADEIAARHERTGIAAVLPGFTLQQQWATQERFEEAFVLDRRSPFWTTTPVNLGHPQQREVGNDPAPRYFPHLVPVAYPQFGFGAPRFPSTDTTDAGATPANATTPPGRWPVQATRPDFTSTFQDFAMAASVRGHDLNKAGPFAMQNTGPATAGSGAGGGGAGGGGAGGGAGGGNNTDPRHDQVRFPFAAPNSFVDRFGLSFWVEPQSLGASILFDHGVGSETRNRLALLVRDNNLVFECLDEAGLDPAPSPAGVQRSAAEWRVPLAELSLPANTPLHVAMSAYQGRAADMSLLVDGVVRGRPRYVTWLSAPLPTFDPNLANNQTLPGVAGNDRYLDLQVESTEGFPPVGVLRIGLELFEYSAIQGNSFRCRYVDSLGGRGARQIGREHRPSIPTDQNGRPTVDLNDPRFAGVNLDFFPAHPAGSMVELYGYSALLSDNSPMMPGATALSGAIGGFAVARGFVQNPRPIQINTPMASISIGRGIDQQWNAGEIELADPIPNPVGNNNYPPTQAQQQIQEAFPTTGGFALLVQRQFQFDPPLGVVAQSAFVGGIELIRYTARQGNKLTGVQRGQTLPGNDAQINNSFFQAGVLRQFVCDWEQWQVGNGAGGGAGTVFFDNVPTLILWVVPISLGVQNARVLPDPATTLLTEWLQIFTPGSPNDTEWVRYDTINNGFVCRANRASWANLYFQLTQRAAPETVQLGPGTSGPQSVVAAPAAPPWGNVTATAGFIGYTPQLESTFPQIQVARQALEFRGDPFTGTSSHAHNGASVLPCHRLQLNWGNYGAYTGRCGRNDRVALVNSRSAAANGSTRPSVEWQTVNWAARRYGSDNLSNQNQTPPELLGPWPFQLVAFQAAVNVGMLGAPANTNVDDPRRFDRVVKFPSGELPAAYCATPMLGAGVNSAQPLQGFVDEVAVTHQVAPDLILDTPCDASAQQFSVDRGFVVHSSGGQFFQNDRTLEFPQDGGLVEIDGEILAYQGRANGVFTVAVNGRGLLNTQARGHDRGARVRFLTHVPAAILNRGAGPRDSELSLQSLGALPARGGTLLLGRELLHYSWVRRRGQQVQVEMPRWFPPDEDPASAQSRGLFRGRFGTAAQGGSSGEAVIAFPFRYWDRYEERSDDPELGYTQLTLNEAPAFFRSLRWREQRSDARVEPVVLVRIDGRSPWNAEPNVAPGLVQPKGGTAEGAGHRLNQQASRVEVRFAVDYLPGAIDLANFRAHAWKQSLRIQDVVLEYEGQTSIFHEQVSAR